MGWGTRKMLGACTTLAALALPAAARAEPPSVEMGDWTLTVDGQLRPRFFLHTGKDFAGTSSNVREFVTQRTRLGATVTYEDDGPSMTLRLQDVRTWGEETSTLNDFDANGLDAHEAFVSLPVAEGLRLRLGRQEIVLDNHRLVGNVGWTQRARSFDGARATFEAEPAVVDLFYAKITEAEANPDGHLPAVDDPDNVEDDVDFTGIHAAFEVAEGHTLAPLFLVNAVHAADHVRETAGFFFSGKASGFDYGVEGYYQFGTYLDPASGEDRTVGAFLAAGRAGYTAASDLAPGVGVWGEYLSGDGTREGTFDTLYATNHKFYGEMDFFLDIPGHTASLGLVDLGGRLKVKPLDRLGTHVDFHHFRSADSGGGTFGNEVDVKLVLDVLPHVQARALYGIFLPEETMRVQSQVADTGGLTPDSLAYLTLDMKL